MNPTPLELWAAEAVGAPGPPQVLQRHHGRQATVSILEVDARRVALKVFRSDYAFAGTATTKSEIAALVSLSKAVDGLADVTCPRVLGSHESENAYVMTYVPGTPLLEVFPGMSLTDLRDVGARVGEAVARFHAVAGRPFGDFQPNNLLRTAAGQIALLDPDLPNPWINAVGARQGASLASVDLGLFAQAMAAECLRHPIRPGYLRRGRNLVQGLGGSIAPWEGWQDLCRGARTVADDRLSYLGRRRLRNAIIEHPERWLVRTLLRTP